MRIGAWIAAAALATGCAAAKEQAVKQAMDGIWNEGDLSIVEAAYEPELANEIKRFVRENRELYPDIDVEIVDSVIKGNRYVTRWKVSGTHADLDKRVVLDGVSVRRREGGVFVEEAMYYDMKSVFDQLGFRVVPPEGTSPFGAVEAAVSRDGDAVEAEGDLPAWPESVGEPFRAEAVGAALAKAAKAAGGTASEADCERYPCVTVLEVAAAGYQDHLAKAWNVLEKEGLAGPQHWPVVLGDRYHAVVALPAGPLDGARQQELNARMHARVAALLERRSETRRAP